MEPERPFYKLFKWTLPKKIEGKRPRRSEYKTTGSDYGRE